MDEPRWLSADEQATWRDFLRATSLLTAELGAELREYGLDLAEYEVLATLSDAPDHRLRMSELASAAHQSRSRLTHTVARFESRGWVRRDPCTADGRGVRATLTDDGLALLRRAAPGHVTAVRQLLVDAVPPQTYAALGEAMRAVLAGLDDD